MEKQRRTKAKRINTLSMLLIAAPGIIYLLINNYVPMAGLFIAFKNYKFKLGIFRSPWCGFDNFRFLFVSNDAWIITRNTLLYNLAFIAIGTIAALTVAILLYELGQTIKAKFFQSALLFPHLVSWIIASYLFYALLNSSNGFINQSIMPLFNVETFDWYAEKKFWPFILLIVYLWKHTGYTAVVYLAGISGINKELYEAAEIDGANRWKQIFAITLPQLKPTIITMVLMAVGRVFYSDFGLFYQIPMDSGPLTSVTQTIDTYVYRALMTSGNFALSSAAGFFQSVCGFVLITIVNGLVRKADPDNALF
ncbi:MAG: ABC transporter permease subunit [Clostridia bacterium]